MKPSHNPRMEKQGNGQQTSPSLGVSSSIPPHPLYHARAPEIYVISHLPLMHQMNTSQHQPTHSGSNYQKFSTQTNVSVDDDPARSDNRNQLCSTYPNQSNENEQSSQSPPVVTSQQPQQSGYSHYCLGQGNTQQPNYSYPSQTNKKEQSSQTLPAVTMQQPLQLAHPFYHYSGRIGTNQPNTAYSSQSSQKNQFNQSTQNVAPQQPQQPAPPYYIYPAQPGTYQSYFGPWQATAPPLSGYHSGVQYPVQPLKATGKKKYFKHIIVFKYTK